MQFKKYLSELNRQEILYTIGAMLLIATKALGFEESTITFRIIMLLGFAFIGIKILLDKNSIKEWILIVVSLGFGAFQFFNMGSLGLVILMALFAGMKGINIKKLFVALACEYVVCFACTTMLAYFEIIDPNYVTTIKHGTEVTRSSLGYAHPNVLQVTYVIVMCLVLYACNFHGKKLLILMSALLVGDIVVYQFSMSETGLIMSCILLILYLFAEYFYYEKNRPIGTGTSILMYIFIVMAMVGYIVLTLWLGTMSHKYDNIKQVYELINTILNQRMLAIDVINTHTGMSLCGGMLDTYGGWALDCSYAYALYSYGIIFYIIIFIAYLVTARYLIKKNRVFDIAIMITLMVGGITEPFLFNVSIKNLSVFVIGEWIYSSLNKNR